MSIIVNGTTIPTTLGSIKVGSTNITTVICNGTTVWQYAQTQVLYNLGTSNLGNVYASNIYVKYASDAVGNTMTPTITNNSSGLYMYYNCRSGVGETGSVWFNNALDVTNYNKITVTFDQLNTNETIGGYGHNHNIWLALTRDKTTNPQVAVKTVWCIGTGSCSFTMDISSLSGSYYLVFIIGACLEEVKGRVTNITMTI